MFPYHSTVKDIVEVTRVLLITSIFDDIIIRVRGDIIRVVTLITLIYR